MTMMNCIVLILIRCRFEIESIYNNTSILHTSLNYQMTAQRYKDDDLAVLLSIHTLILSFQKL
jgi:hypothetical protein